MSTTLSQRLRDLRDVLMSEESDTPNVMNLVDDCIAQAEAQEAQAGELSDEVIEELAQGRILATSSGQVACIDGGQESDVHGFADGLRYARDHYLKPSQAIGEQTPVAYTSETALEELKMRNCGNMSPQSKGFDTVALYRSPISPEARDMAVEALEQARTYIGNTHLIDQALSALRGS